MSEHEKDGGPAFPSTTHTAEVHAVNGPEVGMTLRDYFAIRFATSIMARQPLLDMEGKDGKKATLEEIEKRRHDTFMSAYDMADAMLKARKK